MGIVITNAQLLDLDPIDVAPAELRIDENLITARGPNVPRQTHDEVIDCRGCVVLPGLVNGHTHLYSALAVGMPPPVDAPTTFRQILERIWWRLDRALDAESIEASARIGALAAVRCGTTTLIDHHASPNCIAGSLDMLERGVGDVGLRTVLCYETTDRNGREGRDAGLAENRRYLAKCATPNGRFAALVGAHAAFTLDDDALGRIAGLADEFGTGVHIHVAEDPCDDAECRDTYGAALMDRLERGGLVGRTSVFAHGTHLSERALAAVNRAGVTVAHNARSNMNNAVGYAPIAHFSCPVMLGTDGIGGDMFAELRAAWFKSRDARAGVAPDGLVAMLAHAARRASASLKATVGKLHVGCAADIVITDYRPPTALDATNAASHLIFGMAARHVASVLVDGAWVLRDRRIASTDEPSVQADSVEIASRLWRRMSALA